MLQQHLVLSFMLCRWTQFDFLFPSRIFTMVSGKRLADFGYRAFSTSMMLLTMYGGYLCVMRGYRYMEKQKQLKLAAENQDPEIIKDWRPMDVRLSAQTWTVIFFLVAVVLHPSLINGDFCPSGDARWVLWTLRSMTKHVVCIVIY